MKDEKDYLRFWENVRDRLVLASQLDPMRLDRNGKKSRLIFGAMGHEYSINPIPVGDIVAFEARNRMSFPLNFRTYMMVIGSSLARPKHRKFLSTSAGPGYGISNVISEDIADSSAFYTPSPLEPNKGIGHTFNDDDVPSDNEYKFEYADVEKGTIEIGTSGNPCVYYLVVNGNLKGDVFSCTMDMLFYDGSFENWYLGWLDETLQRLESGVALSEFNRRPT